MKQETYRQIVGRINKTKKLLANFGARPYAYDPGVRCKWNGATINFDGAEWAFLRPILEELVALRRRDQTHHKD